MVRKLMKYECIAYARSILPMNAILLGVAILLRLVQLFENRSNAYNIVFGSSIVVYVLGILVCGVMTVALIVRRFYKNLYTAEGYLSFTLPVNHHQHIAAKLLSALIASLTTAVAIGLSVCLATFGDVCWELFKAAAYLAGKFFRLYGGHGVAYCFEFAAMCLITVAALYLLFYACITVGQLANKGRVALAFGTFFGYYVVTQMFNTVLLVLGISFYDVLHIEQLMEWLAEHPFTAIHLLLCGIALLQLVLGVIYYLITHAIMKHKLNLE